MAVDDSHIRFAREIVDPIKASFPQRSISPPVEATAYLLALSTRTYGIDPDAPNFPDQAKETLIGISTWKNHQPLIEVVFNLINTDNLQFLADVCRQARNYSQEEING